MNRFFDREPGDRRQAEEEREAEEDTRAAEFDEDAPEPRRNIWEVINGR